MDPNHVNGGDLVRLVGDVRTYIVRATRNYHEVRTPERIVHQRTKSYEVRLADDAEHAASGRKYEWVTRTAIAAKIGRRH